MLVAVTGSGIPFITNDLIFEELKGQSFDHFPDDISLPQPYEILGNPMRPVLCCDDLTPAQ